MSQVTGDEILVKSFRAQGPAGEELKVAIWRDSHAALIKAGMAPMKAPFKLTLCIKLPGTEDFCNTKPGLAFGMSNALFSNAQTLFTTLGWKVLEIV